MSAFFISDTHFGDENILRYENRPFADTEEMDRELIRRWNEVVGYDDVVWILGDFGAAACETKILSQLNGIKYLVKGNHDILSNDYYRKAGFQEVYDFPVIYEGFFILSHEGMYVNRNMPYANLFGHVHGSPLVKDFSSQHVCVSVEKINYAPILFEKIRELILRASDEDMESK